MIGITQGTTSQDAAGAFAVLQVLADPKKAQAEYDRLSKLAADAEEVMASAKQKFSEAEKKEKALTVRESGEEAKRSL